MSMEKNPADCAIAAFVFLRMRLVKILFFGKTFEVVEISFHRLMILTAYKQHIQDYLTLLR